MLKYFLIDGNKVPVEEVLIGNIPTRYPYPFLKAAADERRWDGKPHVTDLFSGVRELWLKDRHDYAINPDDAAFRIVGTKAHEFLESHTGLLEEKEIELYTDEVQGRTDLKTIINGEPALVDYKVVGSYKVAKALGIYSEDEPVLDEAGKPVLLKSGKNAGQPKTKKVVKVDPLKAEMVDWIRQLNIYRVLWRIVHGESINRLYIFAVVRDGGTMVARARGVLNQTYTIEVKIAPDEYVMAYIKKRSESLISAMNNDQVPPLCSNEENWDGRKCQSYCPVAQYCKAFGDNPFLNGESESIDE